MLCVYKPSKPRDDQDHWPHRSGGEAVRTLPGASESPEPMADKRWPGIWKPAVPTSTVLCSAKAKRAASVHSPAPRFSFEALHSVSVPHGGKHRFSVQQNGVGGRGQKGRGKCRRRSWVSVHERVHTLFLLRTCSKAAEAFTAWLTDWRTECPEREYRNHASKLPSTWPHLFWLPKLPLNIRVLVTCTDPSLWGGYPPGNTLSPGIGRAPSMLSYSHGSQMR